MAEGSQYVARHKSSGIEVLVTYPGRRLPDDERESLEKVAKGFAHFLGELGPLIRRIGRL